MIDPQSCPAFFDQQLVGGRCDSPSRNYSFLAHSLVVEVYAFAPRHDAIRS